MDEGKLRKLYFNWLVDQVNDDPKRDLNDYSLLLRELHRTNFVWSDETPELAMDVNRAKDGEYLRVIFDCENNTDLRLYFEDIGKNCSMLEMMIALAMRIENEIMGEGLDLYGRWFWYMIVNLGLKNMDNLGFDELKVRKIMCNFAKKTVYVFKKNIHRDCKTYTKWEDLEIWDQMSLWLEEKFGQKYGF